LIVFIGCKSRKTIVKTEVPLEVTTEVVTELKTEELPDTIIEAKIKTPISKVDANLTTKAYDLGKRILMTCNTSKFKPFNESEATQSVIENITEENLSKTCTNFRQRYGTFKDLKLIEVYNYNEAK
jgi:hypothetical protein